MTKKKTRGARKIRPADEDELDPLRLEPQSSVQQNGPSSRCSLGCALTVAGVSLIAFAAVSLYAPATAQGPVETTASQQPASAIPTSMMPPGPAALSTGAATSATPTPLASPPPSWHSALPVSALLPPSPPPPPPPLLSPPPPALFPTPPARPPSSPVAPPTPLPLLPPPPSTPPQRVVDVVNARYRQGRPSSDFARAGILFHMFDQGEITGVEAYGSGASKAPSWTYEPWMPCPSSMWCGTYNDRLSASLLNKRSVQRGGAGLSLFGGVGVIYSPAAVSIWCSFVGDGGTMHPDPNHGCGASPGSPSGWCDPDANDMNPHQCPWRPEHLGHMLALFERKPYGYNEVVVATTGWEAKLPELIEAIIWVEGGHIGRRLRAGSSRHSSRTSRQLASAATSERQARGVHAGFLRHFPDARPRLLKWSLGGGDLDAPFEEP